MSRISKWRNEEDILSQYFDGIQNVINFLCITWNAKRKKNTKKKNFFQWNWRICADDRLECDGKKAYSWLACKKHKKN